MPLYRRLPKRGFVPYGGRTEYAVVNLKALVGFARTPWWTRTPSSRPPDPTSRPRAGQDPRRGRRSAHALTVKAQAVSESAREKIAAKGGTVEVLGARVTAS